MCWIQLVFAQSYRLNACTSAPPVHRFIALYGVFLYNAIMEISKDQVIELLRLFLSASQQQYEEVTEEISLNDKLFINLEFKILADESKNELRIVDLTKCLRYYRKKSSPNPENLLFLKENKHFQTIAEQWKTTTNAFDTYDALTQFCNGVVGEHQAIYGLLCPYNQNFLEKFADGLHRAVQHGSYPVYCLVFLRNLWVDQPLMIKEPFRFLAEALPSILVRRPIVGDYEKSYDWKKMQSCSGEQHFQWRVGRQTAVIEFFWYDREPMKGSRLSPSMMFQVFQQSLDSLFLLAGNASIRITKFRYSFECSGGPNSIFDSSPERCASINKLDKKLSWVGELMLPLLMKETHENDIIIRAFKYYQDSLFRSLGIESRIALSISGLEALYLTNDSIQGEITLRLSLRIAKLLSYLDINPLDIKKNLSRAYAIRSSHVHGSNNKKKSEPQTLIELSENIDQYLRLSILAFQKCQVMNQSVKSVVDELQRSYFSGVFSDEISEILKEMKNTLCD